MAKGKQKEEEQEGGRRTLLRPGARLLGATAVRWKEEPDAEEGIGRTGAGVQTTELQIQGSEGLGWGCPCSQDPGRPERLWSLAGVLRWRF